MSAEAHNVQRAKRADPTAASVEVLLDPCGGLGLLAIEAAMHANVKALSVDVDAAACDAARANAAAAAAAMRGSVEVINADAMRGASDKRRAGAH